MTVWTNQLVLCSDENSEEIGRSVENSEKEKNAFSYVFLLSLFLTMRWYEVG